MLPQLLEWVRFHFPKHELRAASLLAGDRIGIETRPEYWDTIIGSLLQGRTEVAAALLRLHAAAESKPFKLADEVLKSMPVYSVSAILSRVPVFIMTFACLGIQWVICYRIQFKKKALGCGCPIKNRCQGVYY